MKLRQIELAILRYFHRKRTIRAGNKFAMHLNCFTGGIVMYTFMGQTDYYNIVSGEHFGETMKVNHQISPF